MGTSNSLSEAMAKVERAVGPATTRAMAKAGGEAAVKAARLAAASSLGGDRKMSGLKKGGTLDASLSGGGDTVVVSYTGPWRLAESGRRKRKTVRKPGVIFRTPDHPSASFRSGPSRGLHTLTNAQREAGPLAAKAASVELHQQLGRVF